MGILEGEDSIFKAESMFKAIMVENFLNLGRKMNIQIHQVQMMPNRLNPNRGMTRHIITKLSNVKDKKIIIILKAVREKRYFMYKGTPSHKNIGGFLNKNISGQEKIEWHIQNFERKKPLN